VARRPKEVISLRSGARSATRTRSASRRRTRGRQKVLARYRSYHGATYATINLTGDPRRWANENPPMPGVVHVLDPYHGTQRGFEDPETALALRRRSGLEGRRQILGVGLTPSEPANTGVTAPEVFLGSPRCLGAAKYVGLAASRLARHRTRADAPARARQRYRRRRPDDVLLQVGEP